MVTVQTPEGAEFMDLEGLPEGERHLTWTAGPGAFFMVSAGAGRGYTPAGVSGDIDSDAPAPLAGPGARRVAFVETKHTPRRLEAAPEGPRSVPEETIRQRGDLLFVPGDHANLRIGYRVPEDAPEALRAALAGMLDSVEVRRHDA